MEGVLWELRNRADHGPLEIYLLLIAAALLLFWEYPLMLLHSVGSRVLGPSEPAATPARLPAALVVIPTLLRKRDELDSLKSTIGSICKNGYPGPLVVVVPIDGAADAPALNDELKAWARAGQWGLRTRVYVTGTPGRRGKPMAIEQGVEFVKQLVASGELPAFPPVYVSTDADADLGPHALEAIVRRLHKKNWLTGALPNVVAGALHVRGDDFWSGWRTFFTVKGQLTLQVAREYYVSNVGRHNLRMLPVTGVPGAFYCTWSQLFVAIPRFLGYLQTLRTRHWLRWWLGSGAPSFAHSAAEPLPERMAGDTDDTVTAYVASMARFKDGVFTLEAPATPAHALFDLLRRLLFERPLQYEPKARVYTSSPATIKALFKQRRRWNSSRVELTLRVWPALGYHWGIGLPALVVLASMARGLIGGVITYVGALLVFRTDVVTALIIVYLAQVLVGATLTLTSLVINNEFKDWRLALALPLLPLYGFVFKWLPAAVGVTSDVLLFGNITGFAPEWTLKKGRSVRIALLFRLRRALLLLVRAVVVGDVPLGAFWLGWTETPWTPSGFEGWTTGKKPRSILAPPQFQPELKP